MPTDTGRTIKLPLIGPAYTSQSPLADAEQLMNFYLEAIESPLAPDKMVAYPIPGVTNFVTLMTSPLRGLYTINGRLFAAAGAELYEVKNDGSVTAIGALINDGNPVSWASSGVISNQLLCASGGQVNLVNLTNLNFTANVVAGKFVSFLFNYFLALDLSTNTVHVSNLNDGSTWGGLFDFQRSVSGDTWQSMLSDGQYAWLFGGQKTDVYQIASTGPNIFIPVQGVSINIGIAAPYSAAIVNNAPQWVAASYDGSGMIMRAANFAPQRRSTHAVEFALQGYSLLSDAVAFSMQDQGHSFHIVNFPTGAATWVDDAERDIGDGWHQRGFWDANNMQYDAYRPQYHAYCFGKHFVGDRASGNIYTMSINTATDVDGNGIRRARRCSPLRSELNRIFFGQAVLNLEVGLGLQTGQGSNPQVMARWSDDGGKTFGNEHWRSAGMAGQYSSRVHWENLGASRNRVFEFVMSDPIPWRLMGGYVEAEVGYA